jgi:fused signal recognition particle receptor
MLGWFKKKFGKKTEAESKPRETVVEVTAEDLIQEPAAQQAVESAAEQPAIETVVEPAEERQEQAVSIETVEEAAPAQEPAPEPVPDLGSEPAVAAEAAPEPAKEAAPAPVEPAKPEPPAQPSVEQEKPKTVSMFQRLQERLGKTRNSFVHRLDSLFLGKKEIDQQLLDDLEEILITADLGVTTAMELLDAARVSVKRNELSDPQALKGVLRDKILAYLEESDQPAELVLPESGPFVIMVVGVNGVGKTTSIGKIAAKFVNSGQSVLLVAGDTFRAAAIDQLKIWGDRVGVDVVAGKPGSDPSSVVFDGVARAVAKEYDVVLIDTAGRLHTSVNLMEELKKIKRVIGKKLETAPHEVMLVLDATTGQNAVSQAKFFNEAVGVTGLTLTKLDGTAKGGIVANVCRELKIPVRFIGIGEQVDDLRDFDPREFVDALFSREEKASGSV